MSHTRGEWVGMRGWEVMVGDRWWLEKWWRHQRVKGLTVHSILSENLKKSSFLVCRKVFTGNGVLSDKRSDRRLVSCSRDSRTVPLLRSGSGGRGNMRVSRQSSSRRMYFLSLGNKERSIRRHWKTSSEIPERLRENLDKESDGDTGRSGRQGRWKTSGRKGRSSPPSLSLSLTVQTDPETSWNGLE